MYNTMNFKLSCSAFGLALSWIRVIGLVVFLTGFFPIKAPMSGRSDIHDIPNFRNCDTVNISQIWSKSRVGQVIFVVIDALRADFVLSRQSLLDVGLEYGSSNVNYPKMEYLVQLISSGEARAFLAKATPPTVTLPRIKALMTGSIPGFVDVVLNFGSSELTDDNLVEQWFNSGMKVNFFGDDTWMKLFKGKFMRSDGTTSFFVSDYTEVDNNVTRHLDSELKKNDWDVMILHYLGLDHIGHLAGPSSPLVGPKLSELSSIIQKINTQLSEKRSDAPSLMFVLGDHGMSDAGSHGGSSVPETVTPIIALGPYVNQRLSPSPKPVIIDQQDIVPSLAYLTGVPIPNNNLGVLISSLMDPDDSYLAWMYNSYQVSKVMERNIKDFESYSSYKEFQLLQSQVNGCPDNNSETLKKLASSSVIGMSQTLSSNLLEYSLPKIFSGIVLITSVTLLCIQSCGHLERRVEGISLIFFGLEILKILSLASTSFIEEQHQTVYFFAQTQILLLVYFVCKYSPSPFNTKITFAAISLSTMMFVRLARCLNQTGDKWSHLKDFSDVLLVPENKMLLSLWHGVALLALFVLCVRLGQTSKAVVVAFALCYLHNASHDKVLLWSWIPLEPRGVWEAQVVYLVSFLHSIQVLKCQNFKECCQVLLWSLLPILIVLDSPQNTILYLLMPLTLEFMNKFNLAVNGSTTYLNILIMNNLGLVFFFLQGNSNSLSTVNVGTGFTGLGAYNPFMAGVLISVNTFSGPILMFLVLVSSGVKLGSFLAVTNTLTGLEVLFFLIMVTFQRFHLFVWTVFSPKLLYLASYSLVLGTIDALLYLFYKCYQT